MAVLSIAVSATALAQPVPTTVTFSARVDENGTPLTGSHTFVFRLFAAPTGGTALWNETYTGVTVDNGLVFVELGSTTPLDATVFNGSTLYLEVTVDATTMSSRLPLSSVPYAARAGVAANADRLGTHLPNYFLPAGTQLSCNGTDKVTGISSTSGNVICGPDADTVNTYNTGSGLRQVGNTFSADTNVVQSRVSGTCTAGSVISSINADGSVNCEALPAGDITAVLPGTGLLGGASTGSATLSVDDAFVQSRVSGACAPGYFMTRINQNGSVACVIPSPPRPDVAYASQIQGFPAFTTACQAFSPPVIITASGPGVVIVNATALPLIDHTNGVQDLLHMGITQGTANDCEHVPGYSRGQVPLQYPSTVWSNTMATRRVYAVTTAGQYTYYLQAVSGGGPPANKSFLHVQIDAVFYPD